MDNYKQLQKSRIEFFIYIFILLFIIINAIINNDSIVAVVSAICGISYTVFAGKGRPFCYLFGIAGSSFYCLLSFQNALWGNLLLYALYYIPMQILGYFKWNKNLKNDKKEIVKIHLPQKELAILVVLLILLSIIFYFVLISLKDAHPLLDSVTTVFSIGGMYLTVRRAIEQWILWFFVNILSFLMWINIVMMGTKAYSTTIMWAVYTCLAVYFYIEWKKELKNYKRV